MRTNLRKSADENENKPANVMKRSRFRLMQMSRRNESVNDEDDPSARMLS